MNIMTEYHENIARALRDSLDFPIVVDDWGILVKTTPGANYYLTKMALINWRLIEVPLPDQGVYQRGWCYTGQSASQALIAAITYGVIGWNAAEGSEPRGWIKSVGDGRYGPGKYGWDVDGVDDINNGTEGNTGPTPPRDRAPRSVPQ
jgi:hypothetical protein